MSEETTESMAVSAEEVARFLESHPEFFRGRDALLEQLTLPHEAGTAVSLVERQMQLLREKNRELQRHLQHLAQAARTNEVLLERLQTLILKLLASRDMDEALGALNQGLRDDFHADFVALRLFGDWDRPEATDPGAPEVAPLTKVLATKQPVCGYLDPEQKQFLFGSAAGEVASSILLPLCESQRDTCLGLLAVGSVDPRRFHPEMGTIFVSHLGVVATRIIRGHLEP